MTFWVNNFLCSWHMQKTEQCQLCAHFFKTKDKRYRAGRRYLPDASFFCSTGFEAKGEGIRWLNKHNDLKFHTIMIRDETTGGEATKNIRIRPTSKMARRGRRQRRRWGMRCAEVCSSSSLSFAIGGEMRMGRVFCFLRINRLELHRTESLIKS